MGRFSLQATTEICFLGKKEKILLSCGPIEKGNLLSQPIRKEICLINQSGRRFALLANQEEVLSAN